MSILTGREYIVATQTVEINNLNTTIKNLRLEIERLKKHIKRLEKKLENNSGEVNGDNEIKPDISIILNGSKLNKKVYIWQHKYTKKIASITAPNQRISARFAMDTLKKFGEDNEIILIKTKHINER